MAFGRAEGHLYVLTLGQQIPATFERSYAPNEANISATGSKRSETPSAVKPKTDESPPA